MAGLELVTEGFKEGQVGSSAMPHKMNTRSCERVNGLAVVLRGQLSMVGELAGDQWNEGDVSCSVVRRVALPDAFFACDGLFQTFLTVLDEFGAFPAVIQRELDRYLPFLTTTKVLMTAVRNGVGREEAHEAIKEHAVGVALEMRQGRTDNDLFDRLAADPRLGLTRDADRRAGGGPDRVHRRRRGPGAGRRTPDRGGRGHRPCRRGVLAGRDPLSSEGQSRGLTSSTTSNSSRFGAAGHRLAVLAGVRGPGVTVAPGLVGGVVGPVGDHEVAVVAGDRSQQLEAEEARSAVDGAGARGEPSLQLRAGLGWHGDGVDLHDGHGASLRAGRAGPSR